jgi:hypothetical protein
MEKKNITFITYLRNALELKYYRGVKIWSFSKSGVYSRVKRKGKSSVLEKKQCLLRVVIAQV